MDREARLDDRDAMDPGARPEPPRRSRGCFFYGCLGVLVFLALLFVAIAATGYFGARYLRDQFTSPKPEPIPVVELPEAQQQALKDRVEGFEQAARRPGGPPVTLKLTAREINALFHEDPNVRGKIFFEIADGRLAGRISVPLSDLGIDMFKGRYLNGRAIFDVAARAGRLVVRPESITVNNRALPPQLMGDLSAINLAERDEEGQQDPLYIEEIDVEGDQLVITARGRAVEPEPEPEAGPEAEPEAEPDEPPEAEPGG